jgi:hypothetical protein
MQQALGAETVLNVALMMFQKKVGIVAQEGEDAVQPVTQPDPNGSLASQEAVTCEHGSTEFTAYAQTLMTKYRDSPCSHHW